MIEIPSKHSVTGTTIFTVMSALAQEYNAVNLSQGFPDFPIDSRLADLLEEGVRSGYNQYAPMHGLPDLRIAIANDIRDRYNTTIDINNEITVTPGATYAIYTALTTVLNAGDEVIILEPAYDSYIANIETCGAKAVKVPLSIPTFSVDWDRLRDAITPKTKAIIINTPHNPTGAIWSDEDWKNLADAVRDTNIFIISDEVYHQLVYDGKKHFSILQHEELRSRSFAIFSFGKVYNNTGWKIGYCVTPPNLTKVFRQIHQFLCFSVNTPAQYAISRYMQLEDQPDITGIMQKKRDYFIDLLKNTGFTFHAPAAGSYFQTVGYEQISDMPDMEFTKWLTKNLKVATIPVSAFYHNGTDNKIIRFCFAKKEETLATAINNLTDIKRPEPLFT